MVPRLMVCVSDSFVKGSVFNKAIKPLIALIPCVAWRPAWAAFPCAVRVILLEAGRSLIMFPFSSGGSNTSEKVCFLDSCSKIYFDSGDPIS